MVVINPNVLHKVVKTMTPKKERVEEAQFRGTIVFSGGEHFIRIDGASNDSLTPIANIEEGASDSGFVHGDRVLVLIKNHQAIVTKNLTTGLQAKAAKDAASFVTDITDEGITAQRIIANDTFTNTLRANDITADEIIAGMATIDSLDTNYAHISNGVIDNAKIDQANVNNLSANYAHVTNGVIDNAKIGHADVNGLSANYAHVTNGVIDNAKIGHADVNGLNANYAHITNGTIDNAKIGHADVNGLSANYAHINNGVIDNAKIGYADVNGLSANYASISDLNVAKGRISTLEANEAVVNDTLRATNANVEYLKSDWISTDRLVLTGNNKNNYPPVEITESEFNTNKTAYWTKNGDTYTQCTQQSVYDADEQYYVKQTVKSIIEAINTANSSDPQIVVSNDKLIAASMDVAELSAITADMGELTAGKIQKGNNFINLNTSPASMEFKNASTWASATQGLQFDTQGNLNIKGKVTITSGSNVPTTAEMNIAIGNKADKTAAVAEEQYIYISKASGTSSVSKNTTWVTRADDFQNTWTTKRPTYNPSYPVLFVAKQKKVVSGTVTCTTPVKDDTTTVIDGGHITTGTIDASQVTVTNINANNITSGTLSADRIGAGSITISNVDSTIQNAVETAQNTFIFDTTYTMSGTTASFEAHLYKGGVDVKEYVDGNDDPLYPPSMFTWYLKHEDSQTQQGDYIGYGYRINVDISTCNYGAEVIAHFTTTEDSPLLNGNDDNLTDANNNTLTGRTESGESVRVRDLTVVTSLSGVDKLMVIGAEDEHLVSVNTLQAYLNANLDKQVKFNTTAGWNSQTSLVSQANTLYIYTDHQTDSQGRNVAGIKAGDGNAYVVDLPFTDAIATEHIADTTRHITDEERTAWNNKVRCYYAGTENLIFTTA